VLSCPVKSRPSLANLPGINTYVKRPCNPSRINTYKIVELKTLWNQHLQKKAGLPPPFRALCTFPLAAAHSSAPNYSRLTPLRPANLPTFQRSTCQRFLLSPLERTLTKNAPITPLDLTLTNSLDLKQDYALHKR
jgi:hypothetical protein